MIPNNPDVITQTWEDAVRLVRDPDKIRHTDSMSPQQYALYTKHYAEAYGGIYIVKIGSQRYICPKGQKFAFRFQVTTHKGPIMQGAHICHLVQMDLAKRIASGEYVIRNSNDHKVHDYSSWIIMWNDRSIKAALEHDKDKNGLSVITGVDINNCYWKTARNIGLISEKVFNQGLKKQKEWKVARNAAIGSLAKRIVVLDVRGDTGQIHGYNVIPPKYPGARRDVVEHVFFIALKIIRELGDDFLFFFTDCFFVRNRAVKKCQALIKKHGFDSKAEIDYLKGFEWINAVNAQLDWRPHPDPNNSTKVISNINHFNIANHIDRQAHINPDDPYNVIYHE